MAVSLKIGDRTFEVAVPYKLGQMEEAAPFLDQLNADTAAARKIADDCKQNGTTPPATTLAEMMRTYRVRLAALLPGIRKADDNVTMEILADEFDPMIDGKELSAAYAAIFFREAEKTKGEAKAATKAAPVAA